MVSKLPVVDVALILSLCNGIAVLAAWSLKETMGKAMDKNSEEEAEGDDRIIGVSSRSSSDDMGSTTKSPMAA